ncbi:MAG: FAD-binding protein [Candidatus Parvarchaeota archaeon]|nr:FAD-binding protein [Candidatus Parvarchaeota archaeon]
MSNPDFTRINTDVLIIGAGGAGLRAAVEAFDQGASVTVVSKSLLGKAHTVMAEGGIAAALGDVDPQDNWKVHFSDTIVEGVYISDWRLVEKLAKEAPDRVFELEKFGALFDRTPEKKIMQRAFGAHTYRRLCHVGDKTGLEIIRTLEEQALHRDIRIMDEVFITTLIVEDKEVLGAVGFKLRTGEIVAFQAKTVIIAAGGCGRLYKVTSNSWETTGDGIALAFQAGAVMQDMEMIQFHPTGMVWPPGVKGLLVTEGVRGEGGILLNAKGDRFMLTYSPKKKELDARDVVARAIYHEIIEGRGTEHGGVYLDISNKGEAFIKKKLPGMYMQFKEFAGVDITKDKMEVAPTVHYYMGGIRVDPETSQSNIDGLFAVGEAAAGVHGANRLGGNSLADLLVFGKQVGLAAAKYAKKSKEKKISDKTVKDEISRINAFLSKQSPVNPYSLTDRLREAMSKYAGIIRNENDLLMLLKEIREMKKQYRDVGVGGGIKYNPGLVQCFELGNMLTIGELLAMSALERKESRGAHFRSDYPKKSKQWKKNILCVKFGDKVRLATSKVKEMPPELKKLVPEEVY